MRRGLDRALAILLAMAALPFIAVAPSLAGVTLVHDHGDGLHVHRWDPEAARTPHRYADHGHQDHHDHGRDQHCHGHDHHHGHDGHDHGHGGSEGEPGQDGECFLIVVPCLTLGPVATSPETPTAEAPLLGTIAPAVVATRTRAHDVVRPALRERGPPRRGTLAVLLANHALLI